MISKKVIKKLLVVSTSILCVQVALASIMFTGIVDENNKNNKYSLKNLSSLSRHSLSLSAYKFGLQFNGSFILSNKNTSAGTDINLMLRFDKGNATYIMPYKVEVKVPRFKTPGNPVN